MYDNNERLILFDADGTIIDAFTAIDQTFLRNGMQLGDLESFQKRRKVFKYLGGIKAFPSNLKKQMGKQSRQKILATLTEVYRDEALLYPGLAALIKSLIATPGIRVGLVTRNITREPLQTLGLLFQRHDIDIAALDYVAHVPLRENKTRAFQRARQQFGINPARSFACGDEHKDFSSAVAAGMHPFMVSYGFEDHQRLHQKFNVPDEIISRTPHELCTRIRHALDLA